MTTVTSVEPKALRPMVTFAPALLLRKRTQTGMVRIYEAMIARLSGDKEEAPPGWTGLVEDSDDQDVPGSAAPFTEGATEPSLDRQEVYFPCRRTASNDALSRQSAGGAEYWCRDHRGPGRATL
jgi:hypothetical protein